MKQGAGEKQCNLGNDTKIWRIWNPTPGAVVGSRNLTFKETPKAAAYPGVAFNISTLIDYSGFESGAQSNPNTRAESTNNLSRRDLYLILDIKTLTANRDRHDKLGQGSDANSLRDGFQASDSGQHGSFVRHF